MLSVPQAKAQKMIGAVVEPTDFYDGMEIVLEARSGTTSAGHYCPNTLVIDKKGMHSSITTPSILGISDTLIWVLEKATTASYKTGMDQYYLKSKVTGKYLTFSWTSNENYIWLDKLEKSGESKTIADDTAHAQPFCFIRNDDETWASELGSKKYGSFPANWENSTYVVVSLFDPETTLTLFPEHPNAGLNNNNVDGNAWGRVYLANEYPSYNITYLNGYQDTNVWDVRRVIDRQADPRTALNDLCDNIQGDISSEFALGADPGYVGDTVAYNNFFSIIDEALEALSDESVSDERLIQLFDQLLEANATLYDNSSLVPVSDGYYYIKTADQDFLDNAKPDYGWYNSGGDRLIWNAMDSTNNKYIWYVTNVGDTVVSGTDYKLFSFKNVLTGKYISRATSHANSQPIAMVDEFDKDRDALICLNLNHCGQFNITSFYDWAGTYPPRPYHMEGHDSGAGESGTIVLYAGQVGSPSAWFIHKVPQDVIDHMSDYAAYDELTLKVAEYANTTDYAQVGSTPGFVSDTTLVVEADSALSKAQQALTLSDRKDPAIAAALDTLVAKMEAFKKDVASVPDGYYYIRGNYPIYHNNWNDFYFYAHKDTCPGWAHFEKSTSYLWEVKNLGNGKFTIKNVKTGKYINKSGSDASRPPITFSDQPETPQRIGVFRPNGRMYITNDVDSAKYYDPADHESGARDQGGMSLWGDLSVTAGTTWSFLPVSTEDANALIAAQEQNEITINLKKKFQEARREYNYKTNYTLGDKIITDKSQIYANNWSTNEGANIENLIDDNKSTFWNSNWEGTEQDPGTPHYLRIYCENGFPDTVQVNYVMRQDGTWHRCPIQMRIDVSNDSINWTTNDWNDLHLADFNGGYGENSYGVMESMHTDSLHYIVSGIGGYKYVRFITRCSYRGANGAYFAGNTHAVFGYSEYNIYPVTGVDENSYSQTGLNKTYGDALFSAIQEAYPMVKSGTGTQEMLDKLTTALDNFKSISYNDSVIACARYNVENLEAGDEIGQVPSAVRDTYVSTASALLDEYDNIVASSGSVDVSKIADIVSKLVNAFATVQENVKSVATDKWYYVLSATAEDDSSPADGYYATPRDVVRGTALYVLAAGKGIVEENYNSGNQLRWGMDDLKSKSTEGDPDALWHFIPCPDSLGYGSNAYYIQNMHTGYFVGECNTGDQFVRQNITPYPYKVEFIGGGQFHIIPLSGARKGYPISFGDNARQIRTDVITDSYFDNRASLTFSELDLDANPVILLPVHNNSIGFMTMPFAIEELNGADAYAVNNKVDSTGIGLKAKTDFAAGEPMLIIVGDTSLYTEDHSITYIEVKTPDVNLVEEGDTVNGLIGVIAARSVTGQGHGYFDANEFKANTYSFTAQAHTGYIDPGLITDSGEEADMVLYVVDNGVLNEITEAVKADNTVVNVYSIDGVLIKHNVNKADAVRGLQPGIYIIGNKKKIVK